MASEMSESTEVERKFIVPADIHVRLENVGAIPISEKEFTDVYYDTLDHTLCKRDHWLRKRSEYDRWELKYRRMGDVVLQHHARAYREVNAEKYILAILTALPMRDIKDDVTALHELVCNGILHVLAYIKTRRRTYKTSGRATVVVDEMDTGFSVGEIEVLVPSGRNDETEKATEEINRLLSLLGLVQTTAAEGKVEWYLRHHKPTLYRTLVKLHVLPERSREDA
ncbi:thiamine-triphosphatase-like [Ornithodoros turicata]|uniref:thiamine-triphosphatase-like n=1 Tax=Ornithodoros turicata TaxID=34597 RepID=UPI003139C2E5